MKLDKNAMLLYAVTDRNCLKRGISLEKAVHEAIMGGITFLQLREKELDDESFFNEAIAVKKICDRYHIPMVINDNVDIAVKVDANGVHIGQDDMSIQKARKILGKDKIIGVSVGTVDEAIMACEDGADYLGVGAIFPTTSKMDANFVDIDTLKAIKDAVPIPVVAIGGINMDNIKSLKKSGIDGVAIISAIFANEDIVYATSKIKKECDFAK